VPRPATIERTEDRRHASRFELCIPVILSWTDEGGKRRVAAGFSRNIATSGLFLTTRSALPPLSSKVNVELILPPLARKSVGMKLSSPGTVVRAERTVSGGGLGIASRFGRLEHADAVELLAAAD
jgi:hypothetical protein